MKWHKQQHLSLHDKDGNQVQMGSCYPTVYACLLDLELYDVPNFHLLYWKLKDQDANLSKYINSKYTGETAEKNRSHLIYLKLGLWELVRELWLASVGYKELFMDEFLFQTWFDDNFETPYLQDGVSERGIDHVCIFKGYNLYHDPHPSNSGLKEINKNGRSILVKI